MKNVTLTAHISAQLQTKLTHSPMKRWKRESRASAVSNFIKDLFMFVSDSLCMQDMPQKMNSD